MVGRRTCDLVVTGSRPGETLLRNNLRQVVCSVLHTAAILEMLQRQQAARLSSQPAERRTASYIIVERYL